MLSLTVLAAVGLAAMPARAQPEGTDEAIVFSADEVVVDDVLNLVIARGNVEISQGGRVLTADTVTYNPRSRVVAAAGNIVLVEPTGEVVFADYAELDSQLAQGFIENVGILFTDDSRVAADRGVRQAGRTEVGRAVYSPCEPCEDDAERAPLWQLRAGRVIHDTEAKQITYRDAFLDIYGVPVVYTPYFSHPDPSVDRQSGFLAPRFGSTSELGPFGRLFYYWNMAPNRDATIEAAATRDAGPLLGLEYRHRFEIGKFEFDGSVNRSDRTDVADAAVETVVPDQIRGHVFADAELHLTEHWRAGASFKQSSDDTYLDQFEISTADVLRSRAYAEGFYGLDYASAEVLRFQDLRQTTIEQPVVLPWLSYSHAGEPGAVLGGRWFADASGLSLYRPETPAALVTGTEGVDTRRFSLETGWEREFRTDFGLLTNVRAAVRGDLYWSDDVPVDVDPTDTTNNEVETRGFPRATITSSLPLVRQQGSIQQLIEPIVSVTAAPDFGDETDIPNNDSLDVEFDEINLFSDSRFPGLDRVEGGTRVTYGLRFGVFGFGGGSTSLFAGQSYRFTDAETFPDGSGLEDQQSDFVGRLAVTPSPFFNLDYRFRFDHETLDARRQEVSLIAGPEAFRLGGTYTFVDQVAGTGSESDVEEVSLRASSRFAENWTASTSVRRDLELNETRSVSFGVAYGDECITFGIDLRRDFTEDRDTTPGDSIFIVLNLRNLGEVPFSVRGGDLFD